MKQINNTIQGIILTTGTLLVILTFIGIIILAIATKSPSQIRSEELEKQHSTKEYHILGDTIYLFH